MINLLPADDKKQIRAARVNVLLLRYNFLLGFVVLLLVGAIGFTYWFLGNAKMTADATIAENVAKEQSYADVKKEAEAFRSQISSAKTILDSQISYSNVVLNIAEQVPPGTILTALKLDPTSFTGPTKLTFEVIDEPQAIQLRKNFQQKSNMFTNVAVSNVSSGSKYAFKVDLTMTITKEAMKYEHE